MLNLPSDVTELEQAFLGVLIIRPESVPLIAGRVSDADFGWPQHQKLFREILASVRNGEPITPSMLAGVFRNGEVPERYIHSLIQGSGLIAHVEAYAERIRDYADKRALALAVLQAKERLETTDSTETAIDISGDLAQACSAVAANKNQFALRGAAEVTRDVLEGLSQGGEYHRLNLPALDRAMDGGLYLGKAYGFAARKKTGKTVMASTMSYNLGMQGIPHLFVCMEMGAKEIHARGLARHTQVYPSAMRRTKDPEVLAAITAKAASYPSCVTYLDAQGMNFSRLRDVIGAAVMAGTIRGFILDYWQLVQPDDPRKNTVEHLGEVAQWIANFCRKHNVWNVTMAQINQEGNTRGGEGIRLAFDQVYELRRKDDEAVEYWLEMMDTRYTRFMNVGDEKAPALKLNEYGPYFEPIERGFWKGKGS